MYCGVCVSQMCLLQRQYGQKYCNIEYSVYYTWQVRNSGLFLKCCLYWCSAVFSDASFELQNKSGHQWIAIAMELVDLSVLYYLTVQTDITLSTMLECTQVFLDYSVQSFKQLFASCNVVSLTLQDLKLNSKYFIILLHKYHKGCCIQYLRISKFFIFHDKLRISLSV